MWKNNGAPRRRPEKRVFRDCALNHRDARLADVLARRSQAWCWDKRCDRLTCVAGGLSGGRAETLHEFSARVLEVARAKLKKMGVLKRVSHFSPHHGHIGGWTFSHRFSQCLRKLAKIVETVQTPTGRSTDEEKDRDSSVYV